FDPINTEKALLLRDSNTSTLDISGFSVSIIYSVIDEHETIENNFHSNKCTDAQLLIAAAITKSDGADSIEISLRQCVIQPGESNLKRANVLLFSPQANVPIGPTSVS